tara:strand:- start:644 stop:895 length:252 start_codon:yes stop_codon:yes gene_type:complete
MIINLTYTHADGTEERERIDPYMDACNAADAAFTADAMALNALAMLPADARAYARRMRAALDKHAAAYTAAHNADLAAAQVDP